MPPCDDTRIGGPSVPSRTVTILLFLLAQVVAALLIGSVALAVSPTRAADPLHSAFIRAGDPRSGSLLLKISKDDHAKSRAAIKVRFLSAG